MVVDDQADDMFILKRLLLKSGVENKLITFEDSLVAKGYLEAESRNPMPILIPLVLFTDLRMPRINGFELVEWVRTQPAFSGMEIVMLSASEDERDAEEAIKRGADHFFVKYPRPHELCRLVKEAGGRCVGVDREEI